MKEDFYIGWQENASPIFNKARKKFLIVAVSIIVVFAGLYATFIGNYIGSVYFFGELMTIEGRLITYPSWALQTTIEGKEVTVPLVGYGKSSVRPIFEKYSDYECVNSTWKLRGTMSMYMGKYWMELTEGEEGILGKTSNATTYTQPIKKMGVQSVQGEIVDPKCFFGVMDPAFMKIHRSCAIRCISGGIPPILTTKKDGVYTDYYFILDENGEPLNMEILDMVGIPVLLEGEVEQADDWKVIKINKQKALASFALSQIPFCGRG